MRISQTLNRQLLVPLWLLPATTLAQELIFPPDLLADVESLPRLSGTDPATAFASLFAAFGRSSLAPAKIDRRKR